MKAAHLPNILTAARLLSVPATVWLIQDGKMAAAFWMFFAAGLTDAVDGTLARLLNARTVLGGYLDPLADKALLVGIYATLGWTGHLPLWLAALVILRDLLILGGGGLAWAMSRVLRMHRPLFISKVNTTAQIVLAGLVLAKLGLGVGDWGLVRLAIPLVAATTLASGTAYLLVFLGWRVTDVTPLQGKDGQ